jgi:hypothetical protein
MKSNSILLFPLFLLILIGVQLVHASDGHAYVGSGFSPSFPSNIGSVSNMPLISINVYMPSLLANWRTLVNFMFYLKYDEEIHLAYISPASNVSLNAVTTIMVPELNLTKQVFYNESLGILTVPLPFLGKSSYSYQATTLYYSGDIVIGQTNREGILTVQSWWLWLWASILAVSVSVFISICVVAYKLHERKQKEKMLAAKVSRLAKQQQRTK